MKGSGGAKEIQARYLKLLGRNEDNAWFVKHDANFRVWIYWAAFADQSRTGECHVTFCFPSYRGLLQSMTVCCYQLTSINGGNMADVELRSLLAANN